MCALGYPRRWACNTVFRSQFDPRAGRRTARGTSRLACSMHVWRTTHNRVMCGHRKQSRSPREDPETEWRTRLCDHKQPCLCLGFANLRINADLTFVPALENESRIPIVAPNTWNRQRRHIYLMCIHRSARPILTYTVSRWDRGKSLRLSTLYVDPPIGALCLTSPASQLPWFIALPRRRRAAVNRRANHCRSNPNCLPPTPNLDRP